MKVAQVVPVCKPDIIITLTHEEAVKLNTQLEDLEDHHLDPTRALYLALDPVVNKVRNGG